MAGKKKRKIAELKQKVAELETQLAGKKAAPTVSPFAPAAFPDLPPIKGLRLSAAQAGVRYRGRYDVMLAHVEAGAAAAGVLTTSRTRSAPVEWCVDLLSRDRENRPAAIVVNSGNSNAFTGAVGRESVEATARAAADALGCEPEDVFIASTGVIGERLPHDRIVAAMGDLAAGLSPDGWTEAARAIMTTDTFPKGAVAKATIAGVPVTVAGIAKGSGMIAPDMATMLAFVFTDANVSAPALQAMLSAANRRTFNSITVDGDTSTSDTLLVVATRKAAHEEITAADSPEGAALAEALEAALRDLALQVVRDGEGATKFVEIAVTGAESDEAARRIGLAIANSPLVKTAFAGEDPNWGRIVMAVGKSGERAERDRLSIRFGDVLVAENGWVAPGYREEDGAAEMKKADILVSVDIGVGSGAATVWTCDLTNRYIAINADYRS